MFFCSALDGQSKPGPFLVTAVVLLSLFKFSSKASLPGKRAPQRAGEQTESETVRVGCLAPYRPNSVASAPAPREPVAAVCGACGHHWHHRCVVPAGTSHSVPLGPPGTQRPRAGRTKAAAARGCTTRPSNRGLPKRSRLSGPCAK